MPQRMTTPIRPKIELTAIAPCLVCHRVEPDGHEGRILCSSERHALLGVPPNQTTTYVGGKNKEPWVNVNLCI